jgi:hypothetical protein
MSTYGAIVWRTCSEPYGSERPMTSLRVVVLHDLKGVEAQTECNNDADL